MFVCILYALAKTFIASKFEFKKISKLFQNIMIWHLKRWTALRHHARKHDGGPLIKRINSSCDKINNIPVPKVKKRNSLNPYCASKMHF